MRMDSIIYHAKYKADPTAQAVVAKARKTSLIQGESVLMKIWNIVCKCIKFCGPDVPPRGPARRYDQLDVYDRIERNRIREEREHNNYGSLSHFSDLGSVKTSSGTEAQENGYHV
jgi:hypothetical protein